MAKVQNGEEILPKVSSLDPRKPKMKNVFILRFRGSKPLMLQTSFNIDNFIYFAILLSFIKITPTAEPKQAFVLGPVTSHA